MSRRQLLLVVAGSTSFGYLGPVRAQFDVEDATFIGTAGSPALSSNFTEPSGAVHITSTDLIIVGDGGDVARITTAGNQVWFDNDAISGDLEGVTYSRFDGYAYILVECSGSNLKVIKYDVSLGSHGVVAEWTIPLSEFDAHDNTAGMSCTNSGAEAITFIPDSDHRWPDATDPNIGGLILIGSQFIGHAWWVDLYMNGSTPAYIIRDTLGAVDGNQGIALDTATGSGGSGPDLAGMAYDHKADRLYLLKDGDEDEVAVVNWRLCHDESSCEGDEILNRYHIEDLDPGTSAGDDPEGIALWPQSCTPQTTLQYDVFILFDDSPTNDERVARYDDAVSVDCP